MDIIVVRMHYTLLNHHIMGMQAHFTFDEHFVHNGFDTFEDFCDVRTMVENHVGKNGQSNQAL